MSANGPPPAASRLPPSALGYRMPAEWEPHAATWLSWAHRQKTWPGKFEPIPPLYAQIVRTLARFEPVNVLAGGAAVMTEAKRLLAEEGSGVKSQGLEGKQKAESRRQKAEGQESTPDTSSFSVQRSSFASPAHQVTLFDIPTNDAWTRDHGPTFLVGPPGSPPALVDWEFNSWGGKYLPFDSDNAVPGRIAEITGRRRFSPGIILEGGAIDPNGRGTILTTEQCLLNPNRNPQLSRADVERYLTDYLGAKKILWLGEGIEGDDTDGHIDELARFVGPRTVVAAWEGNPDDCNYRSLRDNFDRLRQMTDQDNQSLEVIPLPMPQPVIHNGQRLPASYCNFYIANGVVVVPQFDDPADVRAVEILGRLLPNREIIGLPARDLVWGRGAFHCITQQEPVL